MTILSIGVDVGSTTAKLVVLDGDEIIHSVYEKHQADIRGTAHRLLKALEPVIEGNDVEIMITGSAGVFVAETLNATFVQEVIASSSATLKHYEDADVSIELGGEDAKITFFEDNGSSLDTRMNAVCAAGCGAFIDHLATLLNTDAAGLNELAKEHNLIYPIASRCGVFAKTDVQPLINQGAEHTDIAASILQAVVSQTLAGLGQGRPIRGKVLFLGGPLYFLSQLRTQFKETLNLTDDFGICPENAQLWVALGAALSPRMGYAETTPIPASEFLSKLDLLLTRSADESARLEPLFTSEVELEEFRERHERAQVPEMSLDEALTHSARFYLGIDAGSTTTKVCVVSDSYAIVWSSYEGNEGNPLSSVKRALLRFYNEATDVLVAKGLDRTEAKAIVKERMAFSVTTGYGEDLIRSGLQLDSGEVETVCHSAAAAFFKPELDFVLDIGGQDMKAMWLRNGVLERVVLNEACSSGCGSFLSLFAHHAGCSVEEFSQVGLLSDGPVDLGTRCTVFMQSKVKQVQKEGAPLSAISAGLAYSVVRNALFKVLRIAHPSMLPRNIVVQGGTFLNECVLRAFEKLAQTDVIRPSCAGLMGAYGAALVAAQKHAVLNGALAFQLTHQSCMDALAKSPSTVGFTGEATPELEAEGDSDPQAPPTPSQTAFPMTFPTPAPDHFDLEDLDNPSPIPYSVGDESGSMTGIRRTPGAPMPTPGIPMHTQSLKKSDILDMEQLADLDWTAQTEKCMGCGNKCTLTLNRFSDGNLFISGNRCQRGHDIMLKKLDLSLPKPPFHQSGLVPTVPQLEAWQEIDFSDLPSMYEWKTKRLFNYPKISAEEAICEVGIPRVLNIWDDYPFWATFFFALGIRVRLSPMSNRKIYDMGAETIASDTLCFPAKLVHGHILFLAKAGIENIFLPCLPYNRIHLQDAPDFFNCPVVAGYPDGCTHCIEPFLPELSKGKDINIYTPYLPLHDLKRCAVRLLEELPFLSRFSRRRIHQALVDANAAQTAFEHEAHQVSNSMLEYASRHNLHTIALVGRPYHLDPLINHGIPTVLRSFGYPIIDTSMFLDSTLDPREIQVRSQWTYHHKLYHTAGFVRDRADDISLVQLVSFGCGLDAITTDQVMSIIENTSGLYTQLKIDEVDNSGPLRIRLRSLFAAIQSRRVKPTPPVKPSLPAMVTYTAEMQAAGYTLLGPQMAPAQFHMVEAFLNFYNYRVKICPKLPKDGVIDEALKAVHNDACYPALLITGQFIYALKNNVVDHTKTALIITQTGGPCRASNYPAFIRRALDQQGFGHVPVCTLSVQSFEAHTGFNPTLPMAKRALEGITIGDIIMRCSQRTRPYEVNPGETNALEKRILDEAYQFFINGPDRPVPDFADYIVGEYSKIPKLDIKKPRVGIVGEILVKYDPMANMEVVRLLEELGAEAVTPPLIDFFLYCGYDPIAKRGILSETLKNFLACKVGIKYVEWLRQRIDRTETHVPFSQRSELLDGVLSPAFFAGEGWLLVAESAHMFNHGVDNVLCLQPFGCLPQHVLRCALTALRRRGANIVALDLDPGTSEVNYRSRLSLFMSVARRKQMLLAEREDAPEIPFDQH